MKSRLVYALIIASLLPRVAFAQIRDIHCDDRARLEDRLSNILGAERQSRGLRGPDAILEVWLQPSSGEWTMVQSYANGTACIVAMGEHWETLSPQPDPT